MFMKNLIFIVLLLLLLSSCSTTKDKSLTGAAPLELSGTNFQQTVLENENISVVYFWAVWCGPCRVTAPVFKKLAKTEVGNTTYGKVNVDESPEIATKYGIRSIPTLLFFKDGKVVDKHVGSFSKELVGKKVEGAL